MKETEDLTGQRSMRGAEIQTDPTGQLAEAQETIRALQEELAETNRGLIALTLELEQRVDERTAELRAAHAELQRTNSELLQLTVELDQRVAERTSEVQKRAEELDAANRLLAQEAHERQLAQEKLHRQAGRLRQELAERKRMEEEIRELNAGLERRVEKRTEQLAAANKELEAFSYSVSHDLRAPLRAIDGFSRILFEDFASELSAEAAEYLNDVRANARQMGQLVDDLLAFSRITRQAVKTDSVDVGDLVRNCWESLRPEREGRDIDLVIGDLPACAADRALIKQVWMNLIGNALKYTRQSQKAKIEIGCRSGIENAEPTYFVKDNGVGFDMRYSDKLFGVFQRLHRAEDYEGTGVGLALAQRIVQRHGGRIWADAAPGKGATFYFTLEGDKNDG